MFGDVLFAPYPWYDGISVGCCAYVLFGNRYDASSSASSFPSISSEADHKNEGRDDLDNANDEDKDADATTTTTTTSTKKTTTVKMTTTKGEDLPPPPPPLWNSPLSPYIGPSPTDIEMAEGIQAASLWLDIKNKFR